MLFRVTVALTVTHAAMVVPLRLVRPPTSSPRARVPYMSACAGNGNGGNATGEDHSRSAFAFDTPRTSPYHPQIHQLGNTGGLKGELHALTAWQATRLLDKIAYDGRNMRAEVALGLVNVLHEDRLQQRKHNEQNLSIIDVGCGVGGLTHELEKVLRHRFGNTAKLTAIDTSPEMLRYLCSHVSSAVRRGCVNGIDLGTLYQTSDDEKESAECAAAAEDDAQTISNIRADHYDIATCCMVFHELPTLAHRAMVRSMLRATEARQGEVWIVDIEPVGYTATEQMLRGEPFLENYLQTIEDTIVEEARRYDASLVVSTFSVVRGRARGWALTRPFKL